MSQVQAQEIFRKVINAGLYHGGNEFSSKYMCNALIEAQCLEVISEDDVSIARSEIKKCIERSGCPFFSLSACLNDAHHPAFNKEDNTNNTHIYYNWAEKRPF